MRAPPISYRKGRGGGMSLLTTEEKRGKGRVSYQRGEGGAAGCVRGLAG